MFLCDLNNSIILRVDCFYILNSVVIPVISLPFSPVLSRYTVYTFDVCLGSDHFMLALLFFTTQHFTPNAIEYDFKFSCALRMHGDTLWSDGRENRSHESQVRANQSWADRQPKSRDDHVRFLVVSCSFFVSSSIRFYGSLSLRSLMCCVFLFQFRGSFQVSVVRSNAIVCRRRIQERSWKKKIVHMP